MKANYVEMQNGVEVLVPKGKGRNRLGWVKGEDGNYRKDESFDLNAHKLANRQPRPVHFYITQDAQGNEIERKEVGKGRPHKDYTKNMSDGNFYKTIGAAPVVTEDPVAAEAPVATPVAEASNMSVDVAADVNQVG